MESIGGRINRLRVAKGWSLAELGRRMAKAIHREAPFTGETIRQYEAGQNDPGKAARTALAVVFDKSESYIEFGKDDGQGAPDVIRDQLLSFYDLLSPDGRDRLIGAANRIYNEEHPEASPANPFGKPRDPNLRELHSKKVRKRTTRAPKSNK